MPKYRSKIRIAYGTQDPPTDYTTDTFTTVPHILTIDGPAIRSPKVDLGDMDSIQSEVTADVPENPEISGTLRYNTGNAPQNFLRDNAGTGERRNIQVTWLDPSDDSVEMTLDYIGEILEFALSGGRGQANDASFSIPLASGALNWS